MNTVYCLPIVLVLKDTNKMTQNMSMDSRMNKEEDLNSENVKVTLENK